MSVISNTTNATSDSSSSSSFGGGITSLPNLKFDGYTKKAFIQECAMRIFCESDFDRKNAGLLLRRAIDNAKALADALFIS